MADNSTAPNPEPDSILEPTSDNSGTTALETAGGDAEDAEAE
jgi:hypothetical protein